MLRVVEGKLRIERPDFEVGIDDQPLRFACQAGSGLCKKLAAARARSWLRFMIGLGADMLSHAGMKVYRPSMVGGAAMPQVPGTKRVARRYKKHSVIGTFHVVTTKS